jgi:hypothetical protein
MRRFALPCLLPMFLLALLLPAVAVSGEEVPTFAEATGHAFGERITVHPEMAAYLHRLAATSDRVAVIDQGTSWEGRHLLLAVVTAPENHARLEAIQAAAQRLGDPRRLPTDDVAGLIEDQPVIVWLGGSIHGFELSGSEGLLKLLERLTTAEDEETLRVLREAVVLIDPMLNPDGRDGFAYHNQQRQGQGSNPRVQDWGNDFDFWQALQFRTGHYFFDINRDWFVHTQRETLYRVPTLQAWRPQVVLDAHEMGRGQEFYFDPPTDPVGPYFPDFASRWFETFGDAYAATFDQEGFEYTTRDIFNFFYPGYTTSYGSYQGGVGMLFEQGSSRGLALDRGDGSVRTLADALEHHYQGAWTTVRTAVTHRRQFLRDYYQAHQAALADGGQGVRRYLLAAGDGDPGALEEAVALLRRNGIEVGRTTVASEVGGLRDRTGQAVAARRFPAGTYVVEAAQPRNRLLRSLLEPEVPIPEDFLKKARAWVDRGENPRFYDTTSWSLPLLFNLAGFSSTAASSIAVEAVTDDPIASGSPLPESTTDAAPYAYLLDGGRGTAVAAAHRLRAQGFRVVVTTQPTRLGGEDFAGGTVVLRAREGGEALRQALADLATEMPLEVHAVTTGKADAGFPALGHSDNLRLKPTAVAILGENPVRGYSFGWSWYTLDQRYKIPVTILRAGRLTSRSLEGVDTLLIPDLLSASALGRELGEGGKERLQRWVQEGGNLVALGNAVDFVRQELALGNLRSWYPETKPGDGAEGEGKAAKKDGAEEPQRFEVPGAFLRTHLDGEHWLTAGYAAKDLPVLVESTRIYQAPEGPPKRGQRVVARYAAADALRLSGHLWEESRERLADGVYLYEERVGQGRVILFAEDPNYRAYTRGTERLFLNAVLLGPSAP